MISTLFFAFAAGSLADRMAAIFEPLDDARRRLFCSYSFTGYCGGPRAAPTELKALTDEENLQLFCSYSFTGYCGGPRAAPTELKPLKTNPELQLFCSYSFTGYCGGPRAAPTELKALTDEGDSCPGVSEKWAENSAHVLHSATLEDLRQFYNSATPARNNVPALSRNLDTVLENVPAMGFGDVFSTPLLNKLAYHLDTKHQPTDFGGLLPSWRPQDVLVHAMHMNELNTKVAKKYRAAEPSAATCSCLAAKENALRAELNHIADYFHETPVIQLQRQKWKGEDWDQNNWNINLNTLLRVKSDSDGMDMEQLTEDAAAYLKCKLGNF